MPRNGWIYISLSTFTYLIAIVTNTMDFHMIDQQSYEISEEIKIDP